MIRIAIVLGVMLTGLASAAESIAKIAKSQPDFSILVKALEATGLDKALAGKGEFTVFAPTNEAFKKLPKGTLESLLKPEAKDKLASILKYHVVPAKVTGREAVALNDAVTLNKEKVKIEFEKARLYVGEAKVVNTDIVASNGIIHVIDSVLIPRSSNSDPKSMACEQMLMDAVDAGVDLFNDGDTKSCEAIYKVAVRGVLHIAPPILDKKDLAFLRESLEDVERSDDSRKNSWTLRKAIDRVVSKLP